MPAHSHFTNTLIMAIVGSTIFMCWSLWQHQIDTCLRNWMDLYV